MTTNTGQETLFRTLVVAATGFITALCANWISATASPPFVVVIVGAIVFVVLSALLDRRTGGSLSGTHINIASLIVRSLRTTSLCIFVGAMVTSIWIVSIRHPATGHFRGVPYHAYELGSAATLFLLGAVASLRGADFPSLTTYVFGSCAGLTIAIFSLRGGENAVYPTFFGWLAWLAGGIGFIHARHELMAAARGLWRF